MDEANAERVLQRLSDAGLVDDKDGEITPTRKWSAHLQAAAEAINLEIAKSGAAPQGNPLMVAASKALQDVGFGEADFDDAVRMLVLLEISRMRPEARERLGFGGLLD